MGIVKCFDVIVVLVVFDLLIGVGEVVVLMGVNGVGKLIFVKILSGVL